jgi:hypothetical protein
MRRFDLFRETDASNVSGVGYVAEGVEFTDGTVAIRWKSATPSTVVWASMADAIAIHGHNGWTTVRWRDELGSEKSWLPRAA